MTRITVKVFLRAINEVCESAEIIKGDTHPVIDVGISRIRQRLLTDKQMVNKAGEISKGYLVIQIGVNIATGVVPLTGVTDTVMVGVDLVGIVHAGAVITDITQAVVIVVRVVGGIDIGTIIAGVANAIAVAVVLIGIIHVETVVGRTGGVFESRVSVAIAVLINTIITAVAYTVFVVIRLSGIGQSRTVVSTGREAVAIGIDRIIVALTQVA